MYQILNHSLESVLVTSSLPSVLVNQCSKCMNKNRIIFHDQQRVISAIIGWHLLLTWGSANKGKSRESWKRRVTRGGYDSDEGGSPHSPMAPTSNRITIVMKRHTWATCLVVCSVSEKARLSRLTTMMPGKKKYNN